MSIFVPVADVGEFVVVQQQFSVNVLNVYHILKTGGWTSASLADMAVVLISGYNDDLAPSQASALQYIIVKCRDLTTEAGAVAQVNFPPNSGGDDTRTALPAQNCHTLSHTTGVAGRSFRGRTSLGGICDAYVTGNFMNADIVTNHIAAMDSIDARITAGGGTWGVVSRYHLYTQSPPKYKKVPTPRTTGIFTDIIDTSSTGKVGSMDSRGAGHGQ